MVGYSLCFLLINQEIKLCTFLSTGYKQNVNIFIKKE